MDFKRSDAEEKLLQEGDERDLISFFSDRRIMARQLPRIKGEKSADFELTIDIHKIYIELKSRFDDGTYDSFIDFIVKELSAIEGSYDFSIQIDYRHKMRKPKIGKWENIRKEVIQNIKSIDSNTSFPIELSFCLTDDNEYYSNKLDRLLNHLENSMIITIENRNNLGVFRLIAKSGSSKVFDTRYICDRITDAANQLESYNATSPKGVFFIEQTPHTWGYEEQLSPFFIPTCFIDMANNNKDIIVSRIEQDNILRSDNLNIISFYGFLGRTGGKITELDLFINCYADIQLRSDIIRKFRSFAHWITPRNRQNISLVIRELQR